MVVCRRPRRRNCRWWWRNREYDATSILPSRLADVRSRRPRQQRSSEPPADAAPAAAPAPAAPAPAPAPAPPPLATPAFPERMNKRPRRVRQPSGASFAPAPDASSNRRHGVVRSGGRLAPVHTLPLTPAADEPGLRSASTVQPLAGLEYGPTPFSCPVDTLLTVLRHALTREERRQLRRCASQPGGAGRGGEAGEGCGTGGEGQTARSGCPAARRAGEGGAGESVEASRAVQTSKGAWKAVIEALRLWRSDPSRAAAAKVLWYECMRSQQAQQGGRPPPNGKAALGDCRCRCRCPCAECSSG
ncbi:hypothetical protein EMIHUDRAFT_460133, partial [Emiliania huxleyi CCMP1516]|uniref:Uncharacterized protein n=2 Tax=Emiliania huxleyi TaxID=2903 RepID=A0A0D3I4T1_EMIH1